jgi:histidine triad (HIT) family protein
MKKIYKCDWTSIRQHNEPAWNQHIFHYHLHVLPRYNWDELYQSHDKKIFIEEKERQLYANKFKQYFLENKLF